MKRSLVLLLVSIALLPVGCISDSRQVARIDRAEAVMDSLPEVALSLLDSVDSHRLFRADKARYALLRTQALDKNYIDIANDSLINIAVSYYCHSRNLRYRGMAYYYKAVVCYNGGRYADAVESLVKAEDTLLRTTEYNITALVYSLLSEIYIEQNRLQDAIKLRYNALCCYEQTGNWRNISFCHLRLSSIKKILYPADSARRELDLAHDIATNLNDEELLFIVENHRASLYEYIKEYDLAKSTLDNAFELYPSHRLNADDYHLMSRIYYNTGLVDSALYILDNYYAPLCQTYSDRETLSLFRSDIYKSKQDYNNAFIHLHNYIESLTHSRLFEQNQSINELETKYNTQQLEQETHSLYSFIVFLSAIILLAILSTVLLTYLFLRQRQLRRTQYNQIYESAKQDITNIQQQYDLIKKQLELLSIQNKLYDNALRGRIEMLHTLLDMTESFESNETNFYDKCRSYCDVCNKNDNSFVKDIRDIASLLFQGDFVEVLMRHFPELSNEEINLCCLLLMGFEINHIRILFNHTNIQSTYSKRGRLRKKLGISGNEDIKDFLLSLRLNS